MAGGNDVTTVMPDPSHIATRSELAAALTLAREQARLTVRALAAAAGVPTATVGGYLSGRHLPSAAQIGQFERVLIACGITEPDTVADWLAALQRARRSPGPPPADRLVPYRGLLPFEPEHAALFFGRDDARDKIARHIATRYGAGSGLTLLVGPSGSGKSSLLRAGLIPDLAQGRIAVPGSQHWHRHVLTPTSRPMTALAEALAPDDPDSVLTAADDDFPGLLLVVDQAEELFGTEVDAAERAAFLRWVSDATVNRTQHPSDAAPPRAVVVLGVRADFYPALLAEPDLAATMPESQVLLGPLNPAELRAAVVEPARHGGVEVEPALIELITADLAPAGRTLTRHGAHDAGALPLLSHALLATWQRAERGRMTVAGYRAAGGIAGAVAATAEHVVAELNPDELAMARQLFLRLVEVKPDVADTRRRVRREELVAHTDETADELIDRFATARLISTGQDTVEISHEVLLTAWPRLREWIDADRAGLPIHRRLAEAALAWADAGRDSAALYREGPLHAALQWAHDPVHLDDLNQTEDEFLAASVALRESADAEQRRRTRRLRALAAALAILLVVVAGLGGFALRQRQRADHDKDIAVSRQIALTASRLRSSDPALAAQLAVAAYRTAPTVEAASALLEQSGDPRIDRLVRPGRALQAIAVSGDGTSMVAAGATRTDSAVLLWDLSAPDGPARVGRPLTGHTAEVFAVAYAPDNATFATGGADQTVRLWSRSGDSDTQPAAAPISTGATVYCLRFSPSSRHLLAAAQADGRLILWDVANPAAPVLLSDTAATDGPVQSVEFTPDGRFLIAGGRAGAGTGYLRLWDLAEPRHPVAVGDVPEPALTAKRINTVGVSPDGRTVAVGNVIGQVQLWQRDGTALVPDGEPLIGTTDWINALTFSSDGQHLAVAGSDRSARVYALASRSLTATLPHPEPVNGVSFVDQDRTLVTNSADGTTRFWSYPPPVLSEQNGPVFSVGFGPDGRTLATTSADGSATVWDTSDPTVPRRAGTTQRADANADANANAGTNASPLNGTGAFHPRGTMLAGGTGNGQVRVWDTTDPGRLTELPAPRSGLRQVIQNLSFSPDGTVLAAAGDDGALQLWDTSDPAAVVPLGQAVDGGADALLGVAFSPDGRTVATPAVSGEVLLWRADRATGPVLSQRIGVSKDYVYSAAFTPDGRTLVTGSADGTVALWDLSAPTRPVATLAGLDGYVYSLAISPDGSTLAAGSGTGQVWLWTISDPRRPIAKATITATTKAVWALAFSPDGARLAAGSSDNTVRLWTVEPAANVAMACAAQGPSITPAEWTKYLPGLPYAEPCAEPSNR